SCERESRGKKRLHGREIVHARIENMVLVVQALENLVPRLLWVGKIRIVAHHNLKQRPGLNSRSNEIVPCYGSRPSYSKQACRVPMNRQCRAGFRECQFAKLTRISSATFSACSTQVPIAGPFK